MPVRAPPNASATALARANAKQASLDAQQAGAIAHYGSAGGIRGNSFVGMRRAGEGGPV